MPHKRMTIREQIAAKRELRRLRQLENDLRSHNSGTRIAVGELCSHAGGAIHAALELGYIVLVRGSSVNDKAFSARAYRIGGGQ